MPFSSGNFTPYTPGNPVVDNTDITVDWGNNTMNDIASGLSTCILKDGSQTITANIPFSNFKITGLATGTAATDAATVAQVQGSLPQYLTAVGGTGNAITATASPAATLAVGQVYRFIAAATNTSATTLTIGANAAGAVQSNGAALVGGEIQSGQVIEVFVSAATPIFQLKANGATLPFIDSVPLLHGSSDATKKVIFEVDGLTTATTRTLTVPDISGSILIDTGGVNWTNRLINGDWLIDQINEGALYTYSATTAVGPDGWSGSATGAGVFKLRTLADPDVASLKCLEVTCTTADVSIGATDNYFLQTAVEGYDIADLQPGVSTAAAITIKFKFKTNVTGVYGISVANSATNRSYVGIITVAGTSEAEYTTTLTLDTTGTWLYTNGVGLYMRIALASGANFQTTAGSWGANNMFSTSAQCNFMSANTNVAYLKRVTLVPGSAALAYGPQDIQKALAKAQRYYMKTFNQGVAPAQSIGNTQGAVTGIVSNTSSVNAATLWAFAMRAAPTVTTYNPFAADANWRDVGNTISETVALDTASTSGVIIRSSTHANNAALVIHASASARLS